jgi:ribonucleoside-diphosphate reductase alpha chain
MWTSDLFMKRVQEDSYWTLMCPNECPGLYDVHGESLKKCTPIMKNKGRKTIKAHELWEKILESKLRQEHHTCCTKMQQTANQTKNLGTIRSSICVPKIYFKDEIAV